MNNKIILEMRRSQIAEREVEKLRRTLSAEKDKSSAMDQQVSAKVVDLQNENQALQARMRSSHEQHRGEMTALQSALQQLSEVTYNQTQNAVMEF